MRTCARLVLLLVLAVSGLSCRPAVTGPFVSYLVNPAVQLVRFYYQNERHQRFGSIGRLRQWLAQRGQRLLFAMNGGMYQPGGAPKGLYIEQQRVITPLDTASGRGNFYLKPNGVLYLTTQQQAGICPTTSFPPKQAAIAYATQSGPLLLVGGAINPAFTQGSANLQIRNGVGLLPGNTLVFAYSTKGINLYDFAAYFQQLGCRTALYLDGYVSRLYLPAQGWQQTDGDFGVLIGTSEASR